MPKPDYGKTRRGKTRARERFRGHRNNRERTLSARDKSHDETAHVCLVQIKWCSTMLVYIFSWKNWFQSRFLGQKFALFSIFWVENGFFALHTWFFQYVYIYIYIYIYIYTCKTDGESYGREKYFLLFLFTGKLKNERERVQSTTHVRIVSFAEPKSIHSASDYHRMILRRKINISLFYVSLFRIFLSPFVLLCCLSFFFFRDTKWSCRLFCIHCLTNFKGKLYITRCMWTTARGVSPFIYSLFGFKSNLFQVSTWNPSACLLNGEVSSGEHVDALAPKVQGLR